MMKIQRYKWRLEKDSMDSDENREGLDTPTNPVRLNTNDAVEDTPCS